MSGRRAFLAACGLAGAALIEVNQAIAGPFRRRRCRAMNPTQVMTTPKVATSPAAAPATAPTPSDSFLQPHYDLWKTVSPGMPEWQVLELLGQPLHRQSEESFIADGIAQGMNEAEAFGEYWRNRHILAFLWVYGEIKYDSPEMPATYTFDVLFRQGAVINKRDPFGGRLSADGKPTAPLLTWPRNGDRVPLQIVDLRWEPSSGEYPIEYEVEIAWQMYVNGPQVFQKEKSVRSRIPHVAIARVGANQLRWRVRAKNHLGESDWSDFRYLR